VATPLGAWGGMPGITGTGFSDYLANKGYSNEKDILWLLPRLDKVQQVEMDIKLNNNGMDVFPKHKSLLSSDIGWKKQLINVFRDGVNDPDLINSLVQVVKRGIASHKNRVSNQLTGSDRWNETWVQVYKQWLEELNKLRRNV
jgi:hypothetical protein